MGLIFAKFCKKKDAVQVLESLDNEIKAIEEFRRNTEQKQKWIVGRLLLLLIVIYVLSVSMTYYFFFPKTIAQSLSYTALLICSPIFILLCRRALMWYYNRKISKKQSILLKLREEKKKTLDIVMEKETYKVAKTILEKFAPEQMRTSNYSLLTDSYITPKSNMRFAPKTASIQQPAIRQRYSSSHVPPSTPATSSAMTPYVRTPAPHLDRLEALADGNSVTPRLLHTSGAGVPFSGRPAIFRPPNQRSVLDKMVEYLMGDGPNSRYALICPHCAGHNGMAYEEDFLYTSFRCCYCYAYNPSRKQRPQAPLIQINALTPPPALKQRSDSSTSESEKNSGSEAEVDEDRSSVEKGSPKDDDAVIETLFSGKEAASEKQSESIVEQSSTETSQS